MHHLKVKSKRMRKTEEKAREGSSKARVERTKVKAVNDRLSMKVKQIYSGD